MTFVYSAQNKYRLEKLVYNAPTCIAPFINNYGVLSTNAHYIGTDTICTGSLSEDAITMTSLSDD